MSNGSIPQINSPVNLNFDQKNPSRGKNKCRWWEIAGWVSVLVLLILASFAFSQTSALAPTGYAIPFGLTCVGIAGTVIIIELSYKAISFYKEKNSKDFIRELDAFL